MPTKKYGPVRPSRKFPTWIKPPRAARRIASEALQARSTLPKYRRGGLDAAKARRQGITSGVLRAKSIAAGELQPAEDIRDFFNRFRSQYEDAILQDKPWTHSKVQQAWDLWGGKPMHDAALKALKAK